MSPFDTVKIDIGDGIEVDVYRNLPGVGFDDRGKEHTLTPLQREWAEDAFAELDSPEREAWQEARDQYETETQRCRPV